MLKTLYPLKLFFTKKPIIISTALASLINLAGWLWIYFGATPRGEEAVLHYNILFQVDRLGEFSNLYNVPAIGLIILLFNLLVAWLIYSHDEFLADMLLVVTAIIELGVLGAVTVLVFLNG